MLADNDGGVEHPFNLKVGGYQQKLYLGKSWPLYSFVWNKFQGYLLGNPVTDYKYDGESKVPFAHGMSLISDELYEVI